MASTSVTISDDLVTNHSLEFVERQLFYEYDAAYRALVIEGMPYEQEVRAYEDALETITHLRQSLEDARGESMAQTVEALDLDL